MSKTTNRPDATADTTADALEEGRPKVMTLKSLDQVRILADSLRVRILEGYGQEARTTKQLAKILGEKPSKLYHHVEALEKVGLIRLEHTRQNRGTIEKYFRPVAETFRADASLFSSQSPEEPISPMEEVVTASLESAGDELRALFRSGEGGRLESEGLFSRFRLRGSAEEIETLRDGLETWLQEILEPREETGDETQAAGAGSWGCVIAFYPVPEPPRGSEKDPESA